MRPADDPDSAVPFRLWPPVAIALPWLAGWILTRTVGDPIALGAWRLPVALALGAFFVAWNGWSLWLFARHETGLLPGQPTRAIIEEGPYRLSRNPLYLGLVVFDVALALLVPSVWALILVPVAVVLLEWGAIRPEERYLRRRFGAAGYDAYAARVRRWL